MRCLPLCLFWLGASEDADAEWMNALAAAAAAGREESVAESVGDGASTDLNMLVRRSEATPSKPSLDAVARQIDTNGDSQFTVDELQAWMQLQWRRRFARVKAAVNVDPLETIEGTMKKIDTNEDNAISYAEFSNYTSKAGKGREWLQPDKIFQLADENHDLSVSYNEFVLLLHPELSKNHGYVHLLARKRMSELDLDRDGHIDFTEFLLHHNRAHLEEGAAGVHTKLADEGLSADAVLTLRQTFGAQDENRDSLLDMEDVERWIKREENPTDFSLDAQEMVAGASSIADLTAFESELMEFVHTEL